MIRDTAKSSARRYQEEDINHIKCLCTTLWVKSKQTTISAPEDQRTRKSAPGIGTKELISAVLSDRQRSGTLWPSTKRQDERRLGPVLAALTSKLLQVSTGALKFASIKRLLGVVHNYYLVLGFVNNKNELINKTNVFLGEYWITFTKSIVGIDQLVGQFFIQNGCHLKFSQFPDSLISML